MFLKEKGKKEKGKKGFGEWGVGYGNRWVTANMKLLVNSITYRRLTHPTPDS